MPGFTAFFVFAASLISLCIYIYLVILAGRFVSAFERISAAAERAADTYAHRAGPSGPVL